MFPEWLVNPPAIKPLQGIKKMQKQFFVIASPTCEEQKEKVRCHLFQCLCVASSFLIMMKNLWRQFIWWRDHTEGVLWTPNIWLILRKIFNIVNWAIRKVSQLYIFFSQVAPILSQPARLRGYPLPNIRLNSVKISIYNTVITYFGIKLFTELSTRVLNCKKKKYILVTLLHLALAILGFNIIYMIEYCIFVK